MNTGTVVQVIGPVIDVRFPDEVPAIYNALTVSIGTGDGQARDVVCEVQQHLGDDKVQGRRHGLHRRPRARRRGGRHRACR